MPEQAIVIGSGLSAIGAIRGLVQQGCKPLVLDVGDTLDDASLQKSQQLSQKKPVKWSRIERDSIGKSQSPEAGGTIPRKLLFGSDFFYGDSRADAPIYHEGSIPPFSYALGGLSEAWGAASMPPHFSDLIDWPEEAKNLNPFIEMLLEDLPYSAVDDGLSTHFPLLTKQAASLRVSEADNVILSLLSSKDSAVSENFLYGQARLLVYAKDKDGQRNCQYCGCCMAGCVYGSIYKASAEIQQLIKQDLIEYRPACLVDSVGEVDNSVTVNFLEQGVRKQIQAKQLFMAAGAVNTTRIVMNSLNTQEQSTTLRSRGGYLVPVFSFRRLPMAWPETNTQPGVFVEMKGKGLKNWVHVQISSENELLYKRLGYSLGDKGILASIKKFLLEHIAIAFVNFHSDYGPQYELKSKVDDLTQTATLYSTKKKSVLFYWASLVVSVKMLYHFIPRGLVPILPASINNSGSYHVGGTLPMRDKPSKPFETDCLGRLTVWKNIFIVDTASFPSLPGTSIGLATMANAMRITLSAFGCKKSKGN